MKKNEGKEKLYQKHELAELYDLWNAIINAARVIVGKPVRENNNPYRERL